ncbi:hypothetical protein [Pendulispora albinea]|uniref:hypothetical protein n=1 Tax=Pendulispora albinea TaxID=2741071 RepID=UPI00374E18E6
MESATSRIYFCEGVYEGSITHPRALSYFGGLDCGTWAYIGKRATIRSAPGSIALHIANAKDVAVADLDFEAPSASGKGASSIAGFIANSTVSLTRTSFTAGAGRDGESGPAEGGTFNPAVAPNGKGAQFRRFPQPIYQANDLCPESIGGGGASEGRGQAGSPVMPTPHPDTSTDGAGGADYGVDRCNPAAHTGSNGSGGAPGQPATRYGVLDANGWHADPGGAGGKGGVAQGGGGAGGSNLGTAVGFWWGASGGAGGCGGVGGSGGLSGGSSLALIAFGAHVTIRDSRFSADTAGIGGTGGGGQMGQTGGAGGIGSDEHACPGGRGGAGGSGGGGAGGAGGLSVGILFTSSALTIDGRPARTAASYDGITIAAVGVSGGMGGPGGAPVPGVTDELTRGTPGTPGKSGVISALFELP